MDLRELSGFKTLLLSAVIVGSAYSSFAVSGQETSSQEQPSSAISKSSDSPVPAVAKPELSSPPRLFQSATAQSVAYEPQAPSNNPTPFVTQSSQGTITVVAWLAGTLLVSFLTLPRDRRSHTHSQ